MIRVFLSSLAIPNVRASREQQREHTKPSSAREKMMFTFARGCQDSRELKLPFIKTKVRTLREMPETGIRMAEDGAVLSVYPAALGPGVEGLRRPYRFSIDEKMGAHCRAPMINVVRVPWPRRSP